jgi:uncharacterized membrane protein YkoI
MAFYYVTPHTDTQLTLMNTPRTVTLSLLVAMLLAMIVLRADADEAALIVPMGALAHATEMVEQETGGKVLEIRLADEKGDAVFEAAVAHEDAVLYMRIASLSDTVTQITIKDLPLWLTNYKMEAYMNSISRAKVPLVEAIQKAEKEARAPAIGAGLARPLSGTNAVLAYYIETLKGEKRERQAVDAKTGAWIANPEAVYEPWTPVKLLRRLTS